MLSTKKIQLMRDGESQPQRLMHREWPWSALPIEIAELLTQIQEAHTYNQLNHSPWQGLQCGFGSAIFCVSLGAQDKESRTKCSTKIIVHLAKHHDGVWKAVKFWELQLLHKYWFRKLQMYPRIHFLSIFQIIQMMMFLVKVIKKRESESE